MRLRSRTGYRTLLSGLAMAAVLAVASQSMVDEATAATIVVGTTPPFADPTDTTNTINYVDTQTLSVTRTLPVTGLSVALTDIAYTPSGALFGITATQLYRIDDTTGVATLVGNTGRFADFMNALASDASGTLYAAAGSSPVSSVLYTLDPLLGTASGVGNLGRYSSGDLEFDDSGRLFAAVESFVASGTSALFEYDLDDDQVALIGETGLLNLFGLAFADGTLYGTVGNLLFDIDTSTGAATQVGAVGLSGGSAFGATTLVAQPAAPWLVVSAVAGLAALRAGPRRGRQAAGGVPAL